MLYFDSRDGSIDLPKLFPSDQVMVVDNLAADIVFQGVGPDGAERWIGVEHKKVNDILKCITDGRFAGGQLLTMAENLSDYWLLVEGEYKQGKHGELMIESGRGNWYQAHVGNRRFNVIDLDRWEFTMATKTGLKIRHCKDRMETVRWIGQVASWWWEQGWDKHRSAEVTYKGRDKVELTRPSHARLVAETLPGIGHGKAILVSKKFNSMLDMAIAEVVDWCQVDGIGEKMAERIVRVIQNGGTVK